MYLSIVPTEVTYNPVINEQIILNALRDQTSGAHESRSKLKSVPGWLLDNAVCAEIDDALKRAFIDVKEPALPLHASTISSHVSHMLKFEKSNFVWLKARLYLHGNPNQENDQIRSNPSSFQLAKFTFLLSMCTFISS